MKEIVIKLDDEVYKRLFTMKPMDLADQIAVDMAIKHGKVLPPRHGELKDSQRIVNSIANTNFWLSADNWHELMKAIRDVDTLVEAQEE